MIRIEYDVRQENYLLVNQYDKNRQKINLGDKVIIKMKDGNILQGELFYTIGSKYLYLRTSPIEYYGHKCKYNSIKIPLDDIDKMRKFPTGSQELGEVLFRNKRWR